MNNPHRPTEEEVLGYIPVHNDPGKLKEPLADLVSIPWNAVFENDNIPQGVKDNLKEIVLDRSKLTRHALINWVIGIGHFMRAAGLHEQEGPCTSAVYQLGDLLENCGDLMRRLEELETGTGTNHTQPPSGAFGPLGWEGNYASSVTCFSY